MKNRGATADGRGLCWGRTLALALLLALFALPTQAQPDTTATPISYGPERSPGGAVWRSLAVPGWGQLYNRQYYKMPFVYLALGGLTVVAFNLHDEYILYRQAFQYRAFQDLVDSGAEEENPRQDFEAAYNQLAAELGPISASPLRTRRDNLRRNRDLTILGVGLVYALTTLDAFVSAHLSDFDVGEDLTVSIVPGPSLGGLTASIRLGF